MNENDYAVLLGTSVSKLQVRVCERAKNSERSTPLTTLLGTLILDPHHSPSNEIDLLFTISSMNVLFCVITYQTMSSHAPKALIHAVPQYAASLLLLAGPVIIVECSVRSHECHIPLRLRNNLFEQL